MEEKAAGKYCSKRSFLSSDRKVSMLVNQVLVLEKKVQYFQALHMQPKAVI